MILNKIYIIQKEYQINLYIGIKFSIDNTIYNNLLVSCQNFGKTSGLYYGKNNKLIII